MPTVAQTLPTVSEVLWAYEQDTYSKAMATVDVKRATSLAFPNVLGLVVRWDATLAAFIPVINGDTISAVNSTLPNDAPVGVVVGDGLGVGSNPGAVTLGTTAIKMTIAFRDAAVIEEGLIYESSVLTTTRDAMKLQLEKQDVVVRSKSPAVTQSFTA